MEVDKVFVYGTLRMGDFRGGTLSGCEQVFKECFVDSFQMLQIGGFPGIVPGEGRVLGEVYKIDEKILHTLDCIEGFSGEVNDHNLFNRVVVDVLDLEGHLACRAYVYVFNRAERDAYEVIEGGDWFNR